MDHNRASQSSGAGIVRSANVLYFILAFLSLLTGAGVLVWQMMAGNGIGGLLFGLIIFGAGLVFALLVYRLLQGFGEMVQNTAEIADMLEKMRQSGMQDPEA